MKLPDFKSTLIAAGVGALAMYLYLQIKNQSIVIADSTTALLTGGIIGIAVQIAVRLTGVS